MVRDACVAHSLTGVTRVTGALLATFGKTPTLGVPVNGGFDDGGPKASRCASVTAGEHVWDVYIVGNNGRILKETPRCPCRLGAVARAPNRTQVA